MTLRSYQQDCLDALAQRFVIDEKRRLLVVMATGLGKTHVFSHVPQLFPDEQTLVLAHRTELIGQAAGKLLAINPTLHIAIEQAGARARVDADIIVASVQTLARESRRLKFKGRPFGCVIVDEAHHCSEGNSYDIILEALGCFAPNGPRLLGVTATPNRSNGSLAKFFEEVVFEKNILVGIDEGWLAPLTAYQVHTKTSLDGIKTKAGDFAETELGERVNTATRNLEVVRAWQKLAAERRSTLLFAVNRAHAKDLLAAFRAADVATEMVLGDTPKEERATTLRRFVGREFQVLVNVGIATEGTDLPPIDCVLLARPTKSSLLITQMIGRGCRLFPGKADCLILDVVDNCSRHTLQTAATVLGMPATVNARGADLRKVKKELAAFVDEFPGFSLDTAPEITEEWLARKRSELRDLMARSSTRVDAQMVSLFPTRSDPVASKHSTLSWIRSFDGTLRLRIPGLLKWVEIRKDASDHYNVHLPTTVLGVFPSEASALRVADTAIKNSYSDKLTLLRDKAQWHSDPATDKQRMLIRRLGGTDHPQLSKGDAGRLINQLMSLKTDRRRLPPPWVRV